MVCYSLVQIDTCFIYSIYGVICFENTDKSPHTHTYSQVISTFPSTISPILWVFARHDIDIGAGERGDSQPQWATALDHPLSLSWSASSWGPLAMAESWWVQIYSKFDLTMWYYVILCVTMWAWLSMWSYDSYAVHHSLTCQGPVSCRAYAGQSEKQLAMLAAVGFWGLWTNMPPGWEGAANVSQLCSWLGTSGGPTVSARPVGLW